MGPAVYLDYNATTPVDQRVLDKMLPFFTEHYGNPSSEGHAYGWAASAGVAQARQQVAEALGTRPSCITFTSGASEGISTAIKGIARSYASRGRHIITCQTEHMATLGSCRALEKEGFEVTYLPVDSNGCLDPQDLTDALTDQTILVSVMWANNETGAIQPITAIAHATRERGILFLTDATQAIGKLPVTAQDVDVLTLSGHKLYGPKGVGALYVRSRVRVPALVDGGGQERGMRGGTLNVPGIVGLGEAIRIAYASCADESAAIAELRDRLEERLADSIPGIRFNSKGTERLPNTSSVTFPREISEHALVSGVAVSAGSACKTGHAGTSHVLQAMGLSPEDALRTVRISLGRHTTEEEILRAAEVFISAAT